MFVPDYVVLDGPEKLGFTLESRSSVISFDYSATKVVRFRNVPLDPAIGQPVFPEVGGFYQFDSIYLPAEFSIGAIINTSE